MRSRTLIFLLFLCCIFIAGCNPTENTPGVPSDFLLIFDAHSAISSENAPSQNVHIQIDADGRAEFDRYNTDGAIVFDEEHMVTYTAGQVLDNGELMLSNSQMEALWNSIEEINFFELNDDYRMSMGFSYAFVMIEANGRRHVVDNIGLELAEMKTIVELMNSFLPENASIIYSEGVSP
jgi:hypothetical protein